MIILFIGLLIMYSECKELMSIRVFHSQEIKQVEPLIIASRLSFRAMFYVMFTRWSAGKTVLIKARVYGTLKTIAE